jgi:putative endonuclease
MQAGSICHKWNMYYVYSLFSRNNSRIYVGLTADMKNRLKEHNHGKVKSTKAYVPWVLFHSEKYPTRIEARKREKRLKTSFGKAYLKDLLNKIRPYSFPPELK